VSGRLFQVSAEAQLKKQRPKLCLTAVFEGGVTDNGDKLVIRCGVFYR